MLNPSTLNRVSASYARGYRDGYAGRAPIDRLSPPDVFDRPFSNFDYAEGYKAGANDRRWDDNIAVMATLRYRVVEDAHRTADALNKVATSGVDPAKAEGEAA